VLFLHRTTRINEEEQVNWLTLCPRSSLENNATATLDGRVGLRLDILDLYVHFPPLMIDS
jgi:hypothetical protein